MLVHVRDWGSYHVLGQTLDDAVGEAFDKVAKALGLGYPGGPVISRLAEQGDPQAIEFPRALLNSHDYRFSLSGLKTAVITFIRKEREAGRELRLPDIAASFQQAVIDVQVAKALAALEETGCSTFCIGGGVAANRALRDAYVTAMAARGIRVVFPPRHACTDNAVMIALVALDRFHDGRFMALDDDAFAQTDIESAY
jgi:N6-L-threonylcarbamoyladenine synthase